MSGTKSTREEVQKQAVEILLKERKGLIHVSPRVGKSKIVIDYLKQTDDTPLIIVPFNSIKDSWETEFNKWGYNKKVDVVNKRSLHKVINTYTVAIVDEIHDMSENQYNLLRQLKLPIIGLSGTLTKEKIKELKENFGLDIIFEYDINEAVEENIVSNYEINLIPIPLDTKDKYVEAGNKKKRFKVTERQQYDYYDKAFNKYLFLLRTQHLDKYKFMLRSVVNKRMHFIYKAKSKIEFTKKFIDSIKDKKLIFTTNTEVANELSPHSHHSKSSTNNLDKFIKDEINTLSTCQMVSMGNFCPRWQ
jgi:superfamily II DNA or RNA helicase